jgi:hypothetical protein
MHKTRNKKYNKNKQKNPATVVNSTSQPHIYRKKILEKRCLQEENSAQAQWRSQHVAIGFT